jgi:hypothetical protein
MTSQVRVVDHGAKRAMQLSKQPRLKLRIGVLPSDAGKKHLDSGEKVGQIALWQEFGTPGIKPRSWLFDWLDEEADDIAQQFAADTQRVIMAGDSERTALERRGSVYRQQIEDRIRFANVLRKNEPSTIAKKGFDLPLIDTEQFIETIRWEVV